MRFWWHIILLISRIGIPIQTTTRDVGQYLREIHLVIQWFHSSDSERHQELAWTVCINLCNPYISQIHFLQRNQTNSRDLFESIQCQGIEFETFMAKVNIADVGPVLKEKQAFSDALRVGEAIKYANNLLPGKLIFIANLDIEFDETLSNVLADPLFHPALTYFLSRYEHPELENVGIGTQCGPKYIGSHDVIMFLSPLPTCLEESCMFPLGVLGVENRVMWEFKAAGLLVQNPCDRIKSWHNHKSQWRASNYHDIRVNLGGRSEIALPPVC